MTTDSPSGRLVLSSIRTSEVDGVLRSEIVRLCVAAHGEPDFENLFSYLPANGLHVLAVDADRLVGHAVVTTRWLRPGNLALLRTAYVDAVATSPAHQGRGIGSAVMRHLATLVTDHELACLETDRVDFYRRLGWETWRGPLGGRSAQGLIPTPDQDGIMILRLTETPPLSTEWPRPASSGRSGRVPRSPEPATGPLRCAPLSEALTQAPAGPGQRPNWARMPATNCSSCSAEWRLARSAVAPSPG